MTKRSCDEARRLMEREQDGRIDAGGFADLDRHLESCAGCSAQREQRDPLAMFRLLSSEVAEEGAWAGLWDGVRAGMQERGQLGLREGLYLPRPVYLVAMAAALVLGVGLVALVGLGPDPDAGADLFSAGPLFPAGSPAVATVESIDSRGARVYEMNVVGDGKQVTQLVMIFDEEIDL